MYLAIIIAAATFTIEAAANAAKGPKLPLPLLMPAPLQPVMLPPISHDTNFTKLIAFVLPATATVATWPVTWVCKFVIPLIFKFSVLESVQSYSLHA
jgi:hypothetical protein